MKEEKLRFKVGDIIRFKIVRGDISKDDTWVKCPGKVPETWNGITVGMSIVGLGRIIEVLNQFHDSHDFDYVVDDVFGAGHQIGISEGNSVMGWNIMDEDCRLATEEEVTEYCLGVLEDS